ncbi:MAG: hypothetical protein ABI912_12700 [Actinomycetota bacterium]
MVVLGLLLLAASVGAAVSIAVSNTDSTSFEVFGQTVTSLSPGGLMLVGIGLGVAAVLGMWLMSVGSARNKRHRAAERQEVEQTRSRVDALEEENIRLRKVAGRREAEPSTSAVPSGEYVATSDSVVDREGEIQRDGTERAHAADVDLQQASGRSSEVHDVYPDDRVRPSRAETTPAFDATARHQGNRVFGRRSK